MMQYIWHAKIKWDQRIPPEILERWKEFYHSLDRLQEVRIPRWLGTRKTDKIQLHGFAVASSRAYGAVIYARAIGANGQISCRVVVSKSRVAPASTLSIPRLELQAAELLGRLMQQTRKICQLEEAESFCWSDSTVVLHWLQKQPCTLKTFVANRVASIQTTTEARNWAHVVSGDNPADLVSRGMSMSDFIRSSLWYHGPRWLMEPQE